MAEHNRTPPEGESERKPEVAWGAYECADCGLVAAKLDSLRGWRHVRLQEKGSFKAAVLRLATPFPKLIPVDWHKGCIGLLCMRCAAIEGIGHFGHLSTT